MRCPSRPRSLPAGVGASGAGASGHLAAFRCRERRPGVPSLWGPHAHSCGSPNPAAACVCDSGDMTCAMLGRRGEYPSVQGTGKPSLSVRPNRVWGEAGRPAVIVSEPRLGVGVGAGRPARSSQGGAGKHRRSGFTLGGTRCLVVWPSSYPWHADFIPQ